MGRRFGECGLQGFPFHEEGVNCIELHPQDPNNIDKTDFMMLTGSDDKTARLTSLSNGKVLAQFSGHEEGVECVCFCQVQPLAASGSVDGYAFVWDLQSNQVRCTLGHDDSVVRLCWHPSQPILYR